MEKVKLDVKTGSFEKEKLVTMMEKLHHDFR